MFYNSLLTLLLLGATTRYSVSRSTNEKNSITSPTDPRKQNVEAFILVNSNQVPSLEKSMNNLLSRLAEPMRGPVILRSTSSRDDNLQRTIRQISESVQNKLMQFAKACGLVSSVRKYLRSPKNVTISDDWFSEILLQGTRMLCDLGSITEEISTSIDAYFNKPNATSHQSKSPKRKYGLQFLGTINEATDYSEKLSKCLLKLLNRRKTERSFHFDRVFLNMANGSPKSVLKTFKSNLNNASFDALSKDRAAAKLRIFLCVSVANDDVSYNNCIKELQLLDKCIDSSKRRSDNRINNHEIKLWSRAIQDLSNCKVRSAENEGPYVFCHARRALPKRIQPKVRYIYGRMLDRKISKQSPLYRSVNELGDILSKSAWGKEFVNELCQYFAIYEDGRRKLNKLSETMATSKKSLARYRRVSKSLEVYRKGILLKTVNAINKIHRSALDFERFLVSGIKIALNETWQSHINVLSTMMEWMMKLLDLHTSEDKEGTNSNVQSVTIPETRETDESIAWHSDEFFNYNSEDNDEFEHSVVPRSKDDIIKELDDAMKNLIQSINHVSRFRSTNNQSMMGCLANNLLLVAMFMETIGFVSTLYCMGQNSESTSMEMYDDWKVGRKGRSLFLDYQEKYSENISEKYSPLAVLIYENAQTHQGHEKSCSIDEEFLRISNYSESVTMFTNTKNNNGTMNL